MLLVRPGRNAPLEVYVIRDDRLLPAWLVPRRSRARSKDRIPLTRFLTTPTVLEPRPDKSAEGGVGEGLTNARSARTGGNPTTA